MRDEGEVVPRFNGASKGVFCLSFIGYEPCHVHRAPLLLVMHGSGRDVTSEEGCGGGMRSYH